MIALLAFALLPFINEPIQVDQIEINHLHSPRGEHVFTQLCVWEFEPVRHVRAWRILKSDEPGPLKCYRTGRHVVEWGGRRVAAKSCVETWTQVDVEIESRRVVPPCEREPLGE